VKASAHKVNMDTFARTHVPVSTMPIVLTLMERALALQDGPESYAVTLALKGVTVCSVAGSVIASMKRDAMQ